LYKTTKYTVRYYYKKLVFTVAVRLGCYASSGQRVARCLVAPLRPFLQLVSHAAAFHRRVLTSGVVL